MNSLLHGMVRLRRAGLSCRHSNPRSSCASLFPRLSSAFVWLSHPLEPRSVRTACTVTSCISATAYQISPGRGSTIVPSPDTFSCMDWSASSSLASAWYSPRDLMLRGRNSTGVRRARPLSLLRPPLRLQPLSLLLLAPPHRPMGLLPHARLLLLRRATLSTGACLYLSHPSIHPLPLLPLGRPPPWILLVSSPHRLVSALGRHGTMRARSFTPLSLKAANRPPRAVHRPLMTTQPTCARRLFLSHRPAHASASTPCLPPSRRLPPSILRPPRPPVLRRWSRPCCPLRLRCLLAASLFLYGTRLDGGAETASRVPTSIRLSSPLGTTYSTLCFADATRPRTSCSTRSAGP